MIFAGLKKEDDRKNLIAYLSTWCGCQFMQQFPHTSFRRGLHRLSGLLLMIEVLEPNQHFIKCVDAFLRNVV